jgi:hypothetical protein
MRRERAGADADRCVKLARILTHPHFSSGAFALIAAARAASVKWLCVICIDQDAPLVL